MAALSFIGIDFSSQCYNNNKETVTELKKANFKGKLYIHFDQTTSIACAPVSSNRNDVFDNCLTNLNTQGIPNSSIDGILWEQEGNHVINNCNSISCKSPDDKGFAGFMQFKSLLDPVSEPMANWDYLCYEFYNIYTKGCATGSPADGNANCFVDYNPGGDKCFIGGNAGPGLPPTKKKECGMGKNTVYCGSTITPAERGRWMAKILSDRNGGKVGPIPPLQVNKTIILFPFTNASPPTFLTTLTTSEEFDEFVGGFITYFYSVGCTNIDKCIFGAWGCPAWLAESATSFCAT